jgi:hypothetical protein
MSTALREPAAEQDRRVAGVDEEPLGWGMLSWLAAWRSRIVVELRPRSIRWRSFSASDKTWDGEVGILMPPWWWAVVGPGAAVGAASPGGA